MSRRHVSEIVDGRAPVSAEMAVRLAAAFGTEPDLRVNLEAQYDLWEATQKAPPKVKRPHAA